MNFQQLRIVRETVRQNFNLTEVANALYTSQSGVSKHIKDLEDELGIEIFVRKGKRLLGMTEPGLELLQLVERMLQDASNLKSLSAQFSHRDQGRFVVATAHTLARRVLPDVVMQFKQLFPKVHLVLYQTSYQEIKNMLLEGVADIGIASELTEGTPELVGFPYYRWQHAVIVPAGHPLEQRLPLTLEAIAEYPIVTYCEVFSGRSNVNRVFAEAGLEPDIVMSALDSDVIKPYVEIGLGVGIVPAASYCPDKDNTLRLLPCAGLFGDNTTQIALRRGHYLRSFAYRFIELCSPALSENVVRQALQPDSRPESE